MLTRHFLCHMLSLCTIPAIAQDAPTKTTPVLLHVFADASAAFPMLEDMTNSGRSGVVITHYRSGWGIGYARQRLDWRGEGASLRQSGLFGDYTIEPENDMTVKSLMIIKEFHLASTELFRPCFEAGISFIEFRHDELVTTTPYPNYTHKEYLPTTTHHLGFDARVRLFLPISRAFAFETAVHTNINEVHSYSSFEFGIAVGMVRPPKAKKPN